LKSAGGGGADELEMNNQHPTSNIQHPVDGRARERIGCSVLAVGCWMFLFLVFPRLTSFAQTDPNALPALAPAYGELPPTFWEHHQTTVIIASFAFLAFGFWFVKTRLRPESPKILPPEAVACQALAKLQGQPEDGKLLSEVSQILRRYFSAAFGLPATEMTTTEFCAAITAHEKIGAELAQTVSSFLRVCDQDKFAPKIIAPPINAVDRALELVALAEISRSRSAPVPGAATSKIQNAPAKQPPDISSDVAASGDGRTPR
jgi:hypothetical protein